MINISSFHRGSASKYLPVFREEINKTGVLNMRFIISGKNITVTDGLKSAVEEKLGKLEKYFKPDTTAYVMLSVQKQRQKIEVTIPVKGHTIRAEQSSDDMYVSIDLVEEIIVRQLRKYKTRLAKNSRQNFQPEFIEIEDDIAEDEINIIRMKTVDAKPMTPEEACVEMELLGHSFFVFTNGETGLVNVVYKRKENTYGLIEPEA